MEATTATAERLPDMVSFHVTDWEGIRKAHLEDVPRNATLGEVIDQAARIMELDDGSTYHAFIGERALNDGETLEEAGVVWDAEIEIAPEATAG